MLEDFYISRKHWPYETSCEFNPMAYRYVAKTISHNKRCWVGLESRSSTSQKNKISIKRYRYADRIARANIRIVACLLPFVQFRKNTFGDICVCPCVLCDGSDGVATRFSCMLAGGFEAGGFVRYRLRLEQEGHPRPG